MFLVIDETYMLTLKLWWIPGVGGDVLVTKILLIAK